MNLHKTSVAASGFRHRPNSRTALWAYRIIAGVALLSGLQLSAQPRKTTIGPPYVPGVPDWVYNGHMPRDVRSLFILQYGLIYQAELYQERQYPTSAARTLRCWLMSLAT